MKVSIITARTHIWRDKNKEGYMKKILLLVVLGCVVFSGCALFQKEQEVVTQPAPTPVNQVFYAFPDVPVPRELEYMREKSFIYETPVLKAGVMYFRGNVDLLSLENYFRTNLQKNGWRFINVYRYKDVEMNFAKGDRMCNIRIGRAPFTSEVEIKVGPGDRERYSSPPSGAAPMPTIIDRDRPINEEILPRGHGPK